MDTFWQSLHWLAIAAETLVLVIIFLIPWFLVGLLVFSVLWKLARLLTGKRERQVV